MQVPGADPAQSGEFGNAAHGRTRLDPLANTAELPWGKAARRRSTRRLLEHPPQFHPHQLEKRLHRLG